MKELNEVRWEALVETALKASSKTEEDIALSPKGTAWKAKIAKQLRAKTTVGNPWIAQRLNMGHPSRVTNLIKEVTSVQLKVFECQLVISSEFALRRSVFRKKLIESNFLKYINTQNLQYSA